MNKQDDELGRKLWGTMYQSLNRLGFQPSVQDLEKAQTHFTELARVIREASAEAVTQDLRKAAEKEAAKVAARLHQAVKELLDDFFVERLASLQARVEDLENKIEAKKDSLEC